MLGHIRDFARARRVSPWATLGIVVVRVTVAVKPFVVLPAFVGGYGSLNTFVGLVGPSAAHKGTAMSAATDTIDIPGIDIIGPGSGEGIAHLFARYQAPNRQTGDPGGVVQHTEAVLLYAPEVDTLAALKQRQASTLLPELRKAWSGEALGFAYVDPTKRIRLRAHAYRLGLVVGVQPHRAAALLDDSDAGTPQRFLWMPTDDPDAPDTRPAQPDTWSWRSPTWSVNGPNGKVILDVCDTAAEAIDAGAIARLRNPTGDLDAHGLYARLKAAAALAVLDRRADVTDDDWRLAGAIQAVSDRTRAGVVDALETRQQQENVDRGRKQGVRTDAARETADELNIARITRLLDQRIPLDWVMWSDAYRGIHSRDREHFHTAIDRLVDAGIVEILTEKGITHLRRRH